MVPKFNIPFHELEFSYVRSRGPGGQNVNKTNSAVILRWNLISSDAFTEQQKERLFEKLENRLTKEGDLVIRSDEHRDQDQNRSECLRRLQGVLQKALVIPKRRIATKPTHGSQRRRLEGKKIHGDRKEMRRKVSI